MDSNTLRKDADPPDDVGYMNVYVRKPPRVDSQLRRLRFPVARYDRRRLRKLLCFPKLESKTGFISSTKRSIRELDAMDTHLRRSTHSTHHHVFGDRRYCVS